MKDLRLEGEIAKSIPPDQRLKTAFEFLEFSEALYQAGIRSVGDIEDQNQVID